MSDKQVSLGTMMLLFLFFALGWMLCDCSQTLVDLLGSLAEFLRYGHWPSRGPMQPC